MGDLLGGQKEKPGTREYVGQIKFEGHIVVQDRKGISAKYQKVSDLSADFI